MTKLLLYVIACDFIIVPLMGHLNHPALPHNIPPPSLIIIATIIRAAFVEIPNLDVSILLYTFQEQSRFELFSKFIVFAARFMAAYLLAAPRCSCLTMLWCSTQLTPYCMLRSMLYNTSPMLSSLVISSGTKLRQHQGVRYGRCYDKKLKGKNTSNAKVSGFRQTSEALSPD